MPASDHELSRRSLLRGAAAVAVPAVVLGGGSQARATVAALVGTGSGSLPLLHAARANSLAAMVGVNIHLNFRNSVYGQTSRVVDVLADLGVRHVRDRITRASGTRRGFTALAAHGVKVQGVCGAFGSTETMSAVLDEVVSTYSNPAAVFSSFEGINEPNNNGVPWIEETRAKTRALFHQRSLHDLQRIRIVSPALARVVSGGVEGANTAAQAANLGDLTRYVDLGNVHVYPRLQTPNLDIDRFMHYQRSVTGTKPMVCSEGGYFTAMNYVGGAYPTPADVCGVYLPRMIAEHWVRGNRRFFGYELLDDYDPTHSVRESNFGLLRVSGTDSTASWSPKPHYHAIKNFISILRDPGAAFAPAGLRVSIRGVSDLETSLVSKRDGTRWLLLWRPVSIYDPATRTRLPVVPATATLTFANRKRVTVFNPTVSAAPVHTYRRASSVKVAVGAELLILRVD